MRIQPGPPSLHGSAPSEARAAPSRRTNIDAKVTKETAAIRTAPTRGNLAIITSSDETRSLLLFKTGMPWHWFPAAQRISVHSPARAHATSISRQDKAWARARAG